MLRSQSFECCLTFSYDNFNAFFPSRSLVRYYGFQVRQRAWKCSQELQGSRLKLASTLQGRLKSDSQISTGWDCWISSLHCIAALIKSSWHGKVFSFPCHILLPWGNCKIPNVPMPHVPLLNSYTPYLFFYHFLGTWICVLVHSVHLFIPHLVKM